MSISSKEIAKTFLGCVYVAMLVVILTLKDYREARGAITIALSTLALLTSVF